MSSAVSPERDAAVAEAKDQLREIGALVPTVEDETFAAFYRSELIRYREIVKAGTQDDRAGAAPGGIRHRGGAAVPAVRFGRLQTSTSVMSASSSAVCGGAGHGCSPLAMRARSSRCRASRCRRMCSAVAPHTASSTHWPS